ncbi:MAG: hypothetical protein S4CHLAM37_13620 [Chlamydiia bacterium]|nr:hypothetical protein [Chlamydiia bacterium]
MVDATSSVQPMVVDFNAPKTYVQIEQAKLVEKAKVEAKTGSSLSTGKASDGKGGAKKGESSKDYSKLMPKWMYSVASTYYQLEKDYGPNSLMGKFIRRLQALHTMQEAFAKAIGGATNFGMLKTFLDNDKFFKAEGGGVGIAATEMDEQLDGFKTNGNQQQQDQEKQSEFSAVMNQSSIVQDEGDRAGTTSKALQDDGKTFLSDGTSVNNAVNQMTQSFASIG